MKTNKMNAKRGLSLLLVLAMCFSLFSVCAFAAEDEIQEEQIVEVQEPVQEPEAEAEEPVEEAQEIAQEPEPEVQEPAEEPAEAEEPVESEEPAEEPEESEEPTEEPEEAEQAESVEIPGSCTDADGVTINVLAPVGAFPAGTELVITALGDMAFDVSFRQYAEDGSYIELQPAEGYTVTVSFTLPAIEELTEGQTAEVQVLHIDDENNEEPVGDAVTVEADQEVAIAVEAESFSIYALVVTTVPENVAEVAGTEYDSLQAAINAASDGDTVILLSDLDKKEDITIYKAITLDLNGHTLTGTGNGSVITVQNKFENGTENDTIVIENGTITGGNGTSYSGGAIRIYGWTKNGKNIAVQKVTLDGLILEGNQAGATGGGAIGASGSYDITITNCTIRNNTATGHGGAIQLGSAGDNDSVCTISNTKIYNNLSTKNYGGAIHMASTLYYAAQHTGVTLTLEKGTVLSGNTAICGGAISMSGSGNKLIMNDGEISGNTATSMGGAIYAGQVDLGIEIKGGFIINNTSTNRGGAIYVKASDKGEHTLTIGSDVEITGNESTNSRGGGIYAATQGTYKREGKKYVTDEYDEYVLENTNAMNVTVEEGAKLYNNTAGAMGDDVYVETGSSITLGSADEMNGTLKTTGKAITGWYYDGAKDGVKNWVKKMCYRWNKDQADGSKYCDECTTLTGIGTSGFTALKAAHEGDPELNIVINKIWDVAYDNLIPESVSFVVSGGETNQTVVLNAENEWTATVTGLDSTVAYEVTEQVPENWTYSYNYTDTTADDGTVTRTYNFTNTYIYKAAQASFDVTKIVEGEGAPEDASFTFELADSEGSVFATATRTGEGTVAMNAEFTQKGIYTCTLTEQTGTDPNWTYDDASYTVTFVVSEQPDGTLAAEVQMAEAPVFTNTYDAASVQIGVTKALSGIAGTDEAFAFTMTDEDSNVQNLTITGAGTAQFAGITYTDAGEYIYTVQETAGNALYWTYDSSVYTVVVTVAMDEDTNSLVATPAYYLNDEAVEGITFTNTYSNTSTPSDIDPVNPVTPVTPTPDDPTEPTTPTEPTEPTTPTEPTEPDVTNIEEPETPLDDQPEVTEPAEEPAEEPVEIAEEPVPQSAADETPAVTIEDEAVPQGALPQTGLNWWPVVLLSLLGIAMLSTGAIRAVLDMRKKSSK